MSLSSLALFCLLCLFPRKREKPQLGSFILFFFFTLIKVVVLRRYLVFLCGVGKNFSLFEGLRQRLLKGVVVVEKWKEGKKWVLLLLSLLSSLGLTSSRNLLLLGFLNLCFLHRLRCDVCLVWFFIVQFSLISVFVMCISCFTWKFLFCIFTGFVVLLLMVCDLMLHVSFSKSNFSFSASLIYVQKKQTVSIFVILPFHHHHCIWTYVETALRFFLVVMIQVLGRGSLCSEVSGKSSSEGWNYKFG